MSNTMSPLVCAQAKREHVGEAVPLEPPDTDHGVSSCWHRKWYNCYRFDRLVFDVL